MDRTRHKREEKENQWRKEPTMEKSIVFLFKYTFQMRVLIGSMKPTKPSSGPPVSKFNQNKRGIAVNTQTTKLRWKVTLISLEPKGKQPVEKQAVQTPWTAVIHKREPEKEEMGKFGSTLETNEGGVSDLIWDFWQLLKSIPNGEMRWRWV